MSNCSRCKSSEFVVLVKGAKKVGAIAGTVVSGVFGALTGVAFGVKVGSKIGETIDEARTLYRCDKCNYEFEGD